MNFHSLLDIPASLLSGYDIFISYKRDDSRNYSYTLHEQLKSLDYSCFIDHTEATSGSPLTRALEGGLRRSKTFVLVGTEEAFKSPYVEYEFAEFAKTKRPIIVINVDHALEKDGRLDRPPWNVVKERQLIWTDEKGEAVKSGLPTPDVYESIKNHFNFTRRNAMRRRAAFAATLLIVSVSVVAIVMGLVAKQRLNTLNAEIADKETLKSTYTKQIDDIKGELGSLQTERDTAVTERDDARKELGTLTTDLQTTRTDLETAKTDLATASRERDAAQSNARLAREQERIALGRAREQQRIAFSRQLAAQSLGELEDHPDRAFLLGAQSSRVAPTLESRRSLLQALLRYPNLSAMLHGNRKQASVVVSPDGQTFVSVTADGRLIFWDARTNEQLGTSTDTHPEILVAAFSPDGKTLASGGMNDKVWLWDVATRRKRLGIKAGEGVLSLAFRDDSHLASGGENDSVKFWDVSDPAAAKELAPFPLDLGFAAATLAFSPNGKLLAASVGKGLSGDDHRIELFDVESRSPRARPLKDGGNSPSWKLAFSPREESHLLASSDTHGTVTLWNVATGERIGSPRDNTLAHAGDSIAFSPDGRLLATGSSSATFNKGTITLWDITKPSDYIVRRESREFAVYKPGVVSVSFALDGRALITGHDDSTIGFWDVAGPQTLEHTLELPKDVEVKDVQFGAGGRFAARLDGAGKIYLRDVAGGGADVLVPQTERHAASWMSFDARGESLYAFSPGDQTLYAYSTADGGVAGQQALSEPDSPVSPLTLKRIGGREVLAAVGGDGRIDLWDVTSPRAVVRRATYRQSPAPTLLALSDDGNWMATKGEGGAPALWNLAEREPRPQSLAGSAGDVRHMAFGLGGRWLVGVSSKERIVVWKIEGRAVTPREFDIPLNDDDKPTHASVSPDGATVALGYQYGDVLLWDVASNLPLGKLTFRTNGPRLYFNGDGDRLIWAGGAHEGKAGYADVGFELWQRRACRVANRPLTATEQFQYLGGEAASPVCREATRVAFTWPSKGNPSD